MTAAGSLTPQCRHRVELHRRRVGAFRAVSLLALVTYVGACASWQVQSAVPAQTLVECDDPVAIHKFCSMLPAFAFEARPVITVEEAVRGELEVIAWRDGLKRKS